MEWILVSDRLPSKGPVLVYSEVVGIREAGVHVFRDEHFANLKITHWMPLPQAPVDEIIQIKFSDAYRNIEELIKSNKSNRRELYVALAAISKQVPEKPRYSDGIPFCFYCGACVMNAQYCPHCGNAVDWGDE